MSSPNNSLPRRSRLRFVLAAAASAVVAGVAAVAATLPSGRDGENEASTKPTATVESQLPLDVPGDVKSEAPLHVQRITDLPMKLVSSVAPVDERAIRPEQGCSIRQTGRIHPPPSKAGQALRFNLRIDELNIPKEGDSVTFRFAPPEGKPLVHADSAPTLLSAGVSLRFQRVEGMAVALTTIEMNGQSTLQQHAFKQREPVAPRSITLIQRTDVVSVTGFIGPRSIAELPPSGVEMPDGSSASMSSTTALAFSAECSADASWAGAIAYQAIPAYGAQPIVLQSPTNGPETITNRGTPVVAFG